MAKSLKRNTQKTVPPPRVRPSGRHSDREDAHLWHPFEDVPPVSEEGPAFRPHNDPDSALRPGGFPGSAQNKGGASRPEPGHFQLLLALDSNSVLSSYVPPGWEPVRKQVLDALADGGPLLERKLRRGLLSVHVHPSSAREEIPQRTPADVGHGAARFLGNCPTTSPKKMAFVSDEAGPNPCHVVFEFFPPAEPIETLTDPAAARDTSATEIDKDRVEPEADKRQKEQPEDLGSIDVNQEPLARVERMKSSFGRHQQEMRESFERTLDALIGWSGTPDENSDLASKVTEVAKHFGFRLLCQDKQSGEWVGVSMRFHRSSFEARKPGGNPAFQDNVWPRLRVALKSEYESGESSD